MTNFGGAATSAIDSLVIYVVLSIIAFATSFYGPASAVFSLIQVLWVWSDVEAADTGKPTFPNFVVALVTTIMGGLFNDPLAYGFGVIVIVIIILKVLEKI